jgi:hypothetical protein
MTPKILLAGLAVAAMTGVAAHAGSSQNAGAYAEPSQPVPYSSLKAYMKDSPSQRAKRDWSSGAAASATNASANASATVPAGPNASTPISTRTGTPDPDVADTPPSVGPRVDQAATQPPLNQAPPSNAQPPAANAPMTTDKPGGPAQ